MIIHSEHPGEGRMRARGHVNAGGWRGFECWIDFSQYALRGNQSFWLAALVLVFTPVQWPSALCMFHQHVPSCLEIMLWSLTPTTAKGDSATEWCVCPPSPWWHNLIPLPAFKNPLSLVLTHISTCNFPRIAASLVIDDSDCRVNASF